MKMLLTFDLYLWNHFIPKIKADFFKSKFNSFLALIYISMYKLPRKFLLNYFLRKGNVMKVDSMKLITRNNFVFNKLVLAINNLREQNKVSGFLNIDQVDIYDPNYRYSIGSFRISYLLEGETVKINIRSEYKFQDFPDRITKHLHHWLYSLKEKGFSNDFKVEGNDWVIDLTELNSLKKGNKIQKFPNNKLFV